MQKGFILIFIQIVWISSTLSRSDAAHYLHFLLGCKAVIPCQYYSQQSEAFSWFYKKDETSTETQIFHQNKNGVQHHQDSTKRSVTSNLSLVISHVTESDEGMYSCQNCDKGNCQRGQTTVIRVNKDANGSLICRAEQKFDGYTTATSPNVPSTAFNTTPGGHKEPEYQTSVVYGVSVALSCLSLMALLIFYLRLRLWEACSVHRCSCGLAGRAEEETPVVYSSIIIRKTAKAHTRVTYNDCIYSEIKV
ncbi:uncharacterized protein LOC103354122 isoform X2 [Stegastes partitus]|uniref:Uncharacterized protein LOC103354122 isoform X2 n=1 Tax=Stegastes partitus TaxID=144197 RepID=A0A9Y4JRI7_9TELE|nr:PREDICTED: uncharacterized protein LOC103354122 isoform X2 [Stegastes partitus]